MIKICKHCKLEYIPNPRQGKKRILKQRFCSINCRRKYEKENYISPAKKIKTKRTNSNYKKKELEYKKQYRIKNKDKIKEYSKKYYIKNKARIAKYIKEKRNSNPKIKISHQMSCRIREALKYKNGKTFDILNYNCDQLIKHLEKQFQDGMSWDNYGDWHIDHIIPISAFNFTKQEHEDFKRCWSLKNLRPMWANENIKKGKSLEKHFQPSLKI